MSLTIRYWSTHHTHPTPTPTQKTETGVQGTQGTQKVTEQPRETSEAQAETTHHQRDECVPREDTLGKNKHTPGHTTEDRCVPQEDTQTHKDNKDTLENTRTAPQENMQEVADEHTLANITEDTLEFSHKETDTLGQDTPECVPSEDTTEDTVGNTTAEDTRCVPQMDTQEVTGEHTLARTQRTHLS